MSINYRRKREGRTNYRKRLSLLKGGFPRLVVRKTNTQIIIQLVEYAATGDKVICGTQSKQLSKLGWNYSYKSIPAAYLAGRMFQKKLNGKKLPDKIIVDLGLHTPAKGSRIYATIKGAIDAGLKIESSDDIFPDEKRIKGEHILAYIKSKTGKNQFSKYKDAEKFQEAFDQIMKKI